MKELKYIKVLHKLPCTIQIFVILFILFIYMRNGHISCSIKHKLDQVRENNIMNHFQNYYLEKLDLKCIGQANY